MESFSNVSKRDDIIIELTKHNDKESYLGGKRCHSKIHYDTTRDPANNYNNRNGVDLKNRSNSNQK